MDDPTSPFFLHSFDHPGLVLVSQHLTGENYGSSSRAFKLALSVKNKSGFINGSLQVPDATEDPQQYQHWIRSNNMVISWILNSVSKDITPTIIGYNTALEICNDLRDRLTEWTKTLSNQERSDQLATRNTHCESIFHTIEGIVGKNE